MPYKTFTDFVISELILKGKSNRTIESAYELNYAPHGLYDYYVSPQVEVPDDGYKYYGFAGYYFKYKE